MNLCWQHHQLTALFAGLLVFCAAAAEQGTEQVGGRRTLQQKTPTVECAFVNGRVIPPCPTIDKEDSESPNVSLEPIIAPSLEIAPGSAPEPSQASSGTPSKTDKEIEEVLQECRNNGSFAAAFASIEGCEALASACPDAMEEGVEDEGTVALSSPVQQQLIDAIIDKSCQTESISTCSREGFDFTSGNCRKILENGPTNPQPFCMSLEEANEIFESAVSNNCTRRFTPQNP